MLVVVKSVQDSEFPESSGQSVESEAGSPTYHAKSVLPRIVPHVSLRHEICSAAADTCDCMQGLGAGSTAGDDNPLERPLRHLPAFADFARQACAAAMYQP